MAKSKTRSSKAVTPVWDDDAYATARKALSGFTNISYEDREDIIQDFATAHLHMEGFKGRAKLSTWLGNSLTYGAIDFLRVHRQSRLSPEKRRKMIELDAPGKSDKVAAWANKLQAQPEEHNPLRYWIANRLMVFDADQRLEEYIRTTNPSPFSLFQEPTESDCLRVKYQRHTQECHSCKKLWKQWEEVVQDPKRFQRSNHKWIRFLKVNYPQLVYENAWFEEDYFMADAIGLVEHAKKVEREKADKDKEYDAARNAAINALLAQKKNIDQQLKELRYHGGPSHIDTKGKGQRRCKLCGDIGHNARTCSKKKPQSRRAEAA